MVFWLVSVTHYPIVIVFLSSRERIVPIQIRQWCRKYIGVFPLGVHPGGFPCFMSFFFGVQHHRDFEHDSTFSTLRKDLQNQIWDPGVSIYKTENGGLRPWNTPIYGSLFVLVSENCILFLRRLKSSIFLCIGVGILFTLLFIPFGIRAMLMNFRSRDINFRFVDVIAFPQSDKIVASVYDQFGFPGIALSSLHVVLVNIWRLDLFDIAKVCWLRKALEMYRWEAIVVSESEAWIGMVHLRDYVEEYWRQGFVGFAQIGRSETVLATVRWVFINMVNNEYTVVMVKRITQSQYLKETLVRKCWCHYVSFSELALDTSALMLRFVKRSHSHKLLYTIRNKEKSNMKLDNNRSFYRLASKATLRKASSNSLLLFFLLVYGTYSCECNNCVSLILYVFVITLSD